MRQTESLSHQSGIRMIKKFLIASVLSLPGMQALSISRTNIMDRVRVELFFKSKEELRDRIAFLQARGVNSFNLVNKDKKDDLLGCTEIVLGQGGSICAHWSLKYNKVAQKYGGDDSAFDKFHSFLRDIEESPQDHDGCAEVLLISGSGDKRPLDAIDALGRLKKGGISGQALCRNTKIAVAFNPFFPDKYDRDVEKDRLLKKLQSEQVSKVYLQFGTDVGLLREGLEWLSNVTSEMNMEDLDVCGSVFLPTRKLIAQQKFRPWNGVYLSEAFLGSETGARKAVLEIIQLYKASNVELLFEAPGIRTEKDFSVMENLLKDTDWSKTCPEPEDRGMRNNQSPRALGESAKKRTGDDEPRLATKKSNASNDAVLSRQIRPPPPNDTFQLNAPCILLFSSFDLRLHDNRAVKLASRHPVVIPVFLWSKKEEGRWGVRGALEVPLKDALSNLDERLRDSGLKLVCRNTDNSADELLGLCKEVGATTVYSNMEHTPESSDRDITRSDLLSKNGIQHIRSNSSLLYNPKDVALAKGFTSGHFATLMPFLKTCKKQLGEPELTASRSSTADRMSKMKGPRAWPSGKVTDLQIALVTGRDKWDLPIRKRFPMSEADAQELLITFMNEKPGLKQYESQRSRADLEGATSRLSAHLRLGTLSPYELYHQTERSSLTQEEKKTFSRRLFWRDLAYFQLHTFPSMRERCIRQHYEKTLWVVGDEEERRLVAWQKGQTGYPIVDAAMRELWSTGWMTQSIRMVAASFLVEYLRVNWTKGAEWFHYTLVDADSAINSMMWQNAGRSGIDQWNFVLSPETASQDPSAGYTKKWVPELSKLSKKTIHQPWKASESELEAAGVVLGVTYPRRIVENLNLEREKSVDAVLEMRRNSQEYNDDGGYDIIELPSGDRTKVFTKKEFRIDRGGKIIKIDASATSKGKKRRDRKGHKTGGGKAKKIANRKKLKKELLRKAAI